MLRAFGGEIVSLGAVQLAERFSSGYAVRVVVVKWLKEPPTHNLVRLVLLSRLPIFRYTANHGGKPDKCFSTANAPNPDRKAGTAS